MAATARPCSAMLATATPVATAATPDSWVMVATAELVRQDSSAPWAQPASLDRMVATVAMAKWAEPAAMAVTAEQSPATAVTVELVEPEALAGRVEPAERLPPRRQPVATEASAVTVETVEQVEILAPRSVSVRSARTAMAEMAESAVKAATAARAQLEPANSLEDVAVTAVSRVFPALAEHPEPVEQAERLVLLVP